VYLKFASRTFDLYSCRCGHNRKSAGSTPAKMRLPNRDSRNRSSHLCKKKEGKACAVSGKSGTVREESHFMFHLPPPASQLLLALPHVHRELRHAVVYAPSLFPARRHTALQHLSALFLAAVPQLSYLVVFRLVAPAADDLRKLLAVPPQVVFPHW
jgi:hypothetical protein